MAETADGTAGADGPDTRRDAPGDGATPTGRMSWIYRHGVVVRVTHWINAGALLVLLMSGLQIFNAHPALYWGDRSDFDRPLLGMGAMRGPDGGPVGVTVVLGRTFETTGVLGLSAGPDGAPTVRGFPSWSTLPGYQDLATGRRWHFFFAWLLVVNGAAYLLHGLFGGHLRRDLAPTGADLRHIGRSAWDHLRLRFPRGQEARRYNVLQKLAYLGILVLLPVLILAGLAMSPGVGAAVPALPAAFGGRQAARTVHFLAAFGLVLFTVLHVVMVLISGVWNNMRSMITGWYALPPERSP